MATTVEPTARKKKKASKSSPTQQRFGDLSWLDTNHEVWEANHEAWARDERRFYGGDGVLQELKQFDGETPEAFKLRKNDAEYVNFMAAHLSAITGELSKKRPKVNEGLFYGGLGDVRPRDKLVGEWSPAEQVNYNVDGVGQDGSELAPYMDSVDERAQVTGHRWLFVEEPPNETGRRPSTRDVAAGQRAYLVEWLQEVRNWYFARGQLQFVVIRVPTEEPYVEDGQFITPGDELGYYVLVRKGFDRLGEAFAEGGWFIFDKDKELVDDGRWAWDTGEVPMWIHYGKRAKGTDEIPAISKSSGMELGQIAIGLMNAISARDYDYWDACASRIFLLGGTPETAIQVGTQMQARSIVICVPHPQTEEGEFKPITAFDGSTGAVSAQVSESIVNAKFASAREQSFQQITSTPDSSGRSKEAGHAENKAPLLAMRARERQQSENTMLRFFELRYGVKTPSASVTWPTDFTLQPLVEAIDAAFDTLRRSKLRSPTAEVRMLMSMLKDRGIVNDENEKTIEAELTASFTQQQEAEKAAREALNVPTKKPEDLPT